MSKLPDITGQRLVKALQKAGWVVKSRKGSHVKLTKSGLRHFLIVPVHGKTSIPKGTLSNILRDAGISRDDLLKLV